jgi:hypothetical protein
LITYRQQSIWAKDMIDDSKRVEVEVSKFTQAVKPLLNYLDELAIGGTDHLNSCKGVCLCTTVKVNDGLTSAF